MKLACLSDIHGNLPYNIEPCDLLIIAGDLNNLFKYTEQEAMHWLDVDFRVWLESIPVGNIVGVAGNHDFVFENRPQWVKKLGLPWIYLEDGGETIEGYTIWGSPWQPRFGNLAFNAWDEQELERRFGYIPDDTDILITHAPPYGIGDKTADGLRVGSHALRRRVNIVRPTLHVFGHIHPGRGMYHFNNGTYVNATHVNSDFVGVYDPIYLTLPVK